MSKIKDYDLAEKEELLKEQCEYDAMPASIHIAMAKNLMKIIKAQTEVLQKYREVEPDVS